MMRHALITSLVLLAGTAQAELRLKSNPLVSGPEVRLADLFHGVPDGAANLLVATAPPPGERMALRVSGVHDAIARAGLQWMADAGTRGITVARSGKAVPRQTMIRKLTDALADQLGDDAFGITFAGAAPLLHVADDQPVTLRVEAADLDRRTGRFTAVLVAPADGRGEPVRVAGRIARTVQVPVLRARVDQGAIITAADIELQDMPADRLNRNLVADASDLIGQEAKRLLLPGQPVRTTDVQRALAVQKNALVTMTVSQPGLMLSATGRAIDAGAVGDVVQVVNVQSRKTIQAVVTGPNQVQEQSLHRLAQN